MMPAGVGRNDAPVWHGLFADQTRRDGVAAAGAGVEMGGQEACEEEGDEEAEVACCEDFGHCLGIC